MEALDQRLLLAVDVTAFNVAAGTVTFTGDRGSVKNDTLQLSETQIGPDTYISHNLIGGGGTGNYADSTDIDPGAGISRIKVGTGTSPLLSVNLGNNNDTLALANTWTFRQKVSFNGGNGTDTLQGPNSALTWNITGAASTSYSGNITDTTKLIFTAVEALTAGTAADSLVGLNVASTWSLAGAKTYNSGGGALTFSGFETLQGGTAADSFAITANTQAALKGGSGTDTFTLGAGVVLTGSIAGEAGSDTLDLGAYTTNLSAVLTATAADGVAGTIGGVTAGFSGIDSLRSGTGTDSLTGANLTSTWNLGAAPTYTASGTSLSFNGFQLLQGGTGSDAFMLIGDAVGLVDYSLRGGAGGDSFVFSDGVSVTGNIDGEAGADTLNYSASTVGSIVAIDTAVSANGYGGFEYIGIGGTFAGIDALIGSSSDVDFLIGADADSTWTIDTSRTYQVNGAPSSLSLTSYEDLQGGNGGDLFDIAVNPTIDLRGGPGNDTFRFLNGVTSAGALLGESGTDTLDLTLYSTSRSVVLASTDVNGFSGTDGVSGGFSGIDSVKGGSATDSMTGLSTGTWNISGSPAYVSGGSTLSFLAFENLNGGSGVDTYNVLTSAVASLYGNGGNDLYVFSNATVLTGVIVAGAGSDSLSLSAYTTSVAVALTGSSTNGFAGGCTAISSFAGIDTITAGSGSVNSLTGENVASTWTVNGASGTYNDGTRSLDISTFQSYVGGTDSDTFNIVADSSTALSSGAGADNFVFSADVTLNNSLDGGTGNDTLNVSSSTTPDYASLSSSDASKGFAGSTSHVTLGFIGINALMAGSSLLDSLVGLDAASTWSLNATRTYSDGVSTLTFSGVESLQGGNASDTFDVYLNVSVDIFCGAGDDALRFKTNGVSISGIVDGEGGVDTLDYTPYITPVTVNLADSTATSVSGIVALESFVGGSASDSLIAENVNNAWSITATNTGSVTGTFTTTFASFANLTGGALDDVFTFANGVGIGGTLDAGGGSDTLDFSAYSAVNSLNLTLTSGNSGNAISTGVSFAFVSAENLTGGSGNDTFVLGSGCSLTGGIVGGAGIDTLDYSAYTTIVRVNLAIGTATGIKGGAAGGVTQIENVNGGSGADTLIGDSQANSLNGNGGNDIVVGNDGNDIIAGGDGRDILIGGNGADSISGGADDDILIAGSTSYDNSIAALTSLMAEWGRTDATYATRFAHLRGTLSGGRNSSRTLTASTIFDDGGVVDTLTGGAGQDWFSAFVTDLVTDLNNGGAENRTQP